MKSRTMIALYAMLALFSMSELAECCTIGVMNGSVTRDGRPLLWKNRDTDIPNQEVRYFQDGSHGGYVAVVTTGDNDTTTAYVGVNDEGFAIMNSNALNLVTGSPSSHGILMKRALMECGSVADFESLLVATAGDRGHIWANFGCIDRLGNAVMFEANDWEYRKYDSIEEGGFVVRANAAVWGGGNMGTRYDRALLLVGDAVDLNLLDYQYLVQTVSKDIGGPPSLPCGEWSTDDPALSRYRTRAAGIVLGVLPAEDPRLSTLWCTLGEPSCGIAVPLWSYAGTPPPQMLAPGELSPMCAAIQQKKLYCYSNLSTDTTINTNALVGDDGESGIQGYSLPIELDAFAETDSSLDAWRQVFPSSAEIAQFEADRVLQSYQFYQAEVPPGGIPDPGMVTIEAPNGGETWQAGDERSIIWSKSGNSGAAVDIELLLDGAVCQTIETGAPNSGTYTWTVSACEDYDTGYAVRVTDASSGNFDDSDATFSIVQPVPVAIFEEDFETTDVPGSVWSAADADPQSGLDYWGNESIVSAGRAHEGAWSAYCGAHSDVPDQRYDDQMEADMTLIDAIDLTAYSNVRLSFWIWYETSNRPDYAAFEYWDGSDWVTADRWYGTGQGWENVVYDVTGASLRFRFLFVSNKKGTAEGAYVDDIVLSGTAGLRRAGDAVALSRAGADGGEIPADELAVVTDSRLQSRDDVILECAPNPFRQSTDLRLTMPAPGDARLAIFAANGREVCPLGEGRLNVGTRTLTWRGVDEAGRPVPAGVYFARLRVENRPLVTRRLVLIR